MICIGRPGVKFCSVVVVAQFEMLESLAGRAADNNFSECRSIRSDRVT